MDRDPPVGFFDFIEPSLHHGNDDWDEQNRKLVMARIPDTLYVSQRTRDHRHQRDKVSQVSGVFEEAGGILKVG